MATTEKKLFTKKVRAGSRTYFFDVKESKNGTKYLKISESRRRDSRRTHNRLMIFEEHLEAFNKAYGKAMRFLKARNKRWRLALRLPGGKVIRLLGGRGKAYSVDEKRQDYPNAYRRWTPEDDERLRKEFTKGASTCELADFFGRQESAIKSRLAKLGVLTGDD